jgi:membrane-bound acyltransferase YfiQ involved in biofilm formation
MVRGETDKKGKKNFDFVDTIRCLSMIGIVFEHCTVIGHFNYLSFSSSLFQASVMQFFKFATIAFFLIAGFLINHKFEEYTPLEYLKNRFKNTIGPWFFWVNVLMLLNIGAMLVKYYRQGSSAMTDNFFAYLGEQYYLTVFFSSYWFILNFLICISILLIFKKYIYKIWFGITLGCVSLFYSVNLYYEWIITSHTIAIFGFVFYLWLGVYMNKYYTEVSAFIKRVSIWYFLAFTAFFFLLADLEIILLKNRGVIDAYNTLRITNILYSLSFFLLLLKVGPISVLNKYLVPRKNTYGIYLLHMIIFLHLLPEIFRPLKIDIDTISLIGGSFYSIIRLLVVYVLSLGLVMLIGRTKFRWSVGST